MTRDIEKGFFTAEDGDISQPGLRSMSPEHANALLRSWLKEQPEVMGCPTCGWGETDRERSFPNCQIKSARLVGVKDLPK